MMSLTHAAIAAMGVSFALGDTSLPVMGLAVLGSQLPDIDTSTSNLGQICFPVSRWIEKRYPHRTLTHSFLATAAIAAVSCPLWYFWGWKVWLSLWLGHLLSCFSDTFTKQGVQLFFPAPAWCVCGSNPNKRLTTGGVGEYWVLALAIVLLIINFQLTTAGGLKTVTSQALGLRTEVMEVYNANAANHHVYAEITGYYAGDRSKADGVYLIVAATDSDFVVRDDRGRLYQTGQQIIVSKLSTVIKGRATVTTETITFDDQSPVKQLKKIQLEHPNSDIYLSGQLIVDEPDSLELPTQSPSEFEQFTSSGAAVSLAFAGVAPAVLVLEDQFVTGTLSAKVVSRY
jgi:inner membrane protein